MRFFLTFLLLTALASCGARTSAPQKFAFNDSNVLASPVFATRTPANVIEAKAVRVNDSGTESWMLHLTINRLDGAGPDITAVYAFDALMPYVRLSASDGREEGYVPMSKSIFAALSKSGFKAKLLGSDNRAYVVDVPARTFVHFAPFR